MKLLEFRLRTAGQPLTTSWQRIEVASPGPTLLGISYRPLQATTFGLDRRTTLEQLLGYPFQVIRLGAYWNQIEPTPGRFSFDELDWQIDVAESHGKKIILCLGPLKTFGYPEFFAPQHHLEIPFPEGKRVTPASHPSLLEAAIEQINRLVERYQDRKSIITWQLEHDAVDPLGVEHTWRLDAAFVEHEAEALRQADPTRPLMMNAFLPTSLPVRLSQWWRTRDQGDSLAVARKNANIVGIDYYPRHALIALGNKTLYLEGSEGTWQERKRKQLFDWAQTHERKLMVTEGQAEPWEAVTTPPNPSGQRMASCLPEHIITNYNAWMKAGELYAYLFWGAEYWLLRKQGGDSSYLQAFSRIIEKR